MLTLIPFIAKIVPSVPPPDVPPTLVTTQLDVRTLTETNETNTQIPTNNFPQETELVPISTLSPTIFPTSTPAPPESLKPTPIMSLTITPDYTLGTYNIGVFEQDPSNCVKVDENGKDYENLDRNEEIITGLRSLGFTVTEVPLSSDVVYDKYNVLYMPNGWACSGNSYDFSLTSKIREFLDGTGKGLLIGDPKPDKYYSLDLFPNITTDFYKMTLEDIKRQGMPQIEFEDSTKHFQAMLEKEMVSNYPKAETKLTISTKDPPAKYTFIQVLCHYNPKHCSLVASNDPENAIASSHVPRFIIMPGSEYSVSEYAISGELMKNIILWLAHVPVNE